MKRRTVLGIAAHDLRNPLGAIQITANFWLTRHQDPGPGTFDIVSNIHSSSQFMLQLGESTSRMLPEQKSGKVSLELERTDRWS